MIGEVTSGMSTLSRMPDQMTASTPSMKKRAVFALSQLPANEGVPKLIEVASSHSNPAVRNRRCSGWASRSTPAPSPFSSGSCSGNSRPAFQP